MSLKCHLYSWEDVEELCKAVAEKIKRSGFSPDVVIAIARGGWVPARLLCDYLDIRELYSVKTEHWGVVATRDGKAKLTQPLNADVSGKRVLIVDDVADTGETIKLVKEHVESFSPEEVKIAVVDYKKTSKFIPDFYAAEMEEWRWIVYPWSLREDVRDLVKKAFDEISGLNPKNVAEVLREKFELDVDESIVREILKDC